MHLDRDGIRRWGREVHICPGFDPKYAECEDLGSHQQERGPDHRLRSARKSFDLVPGLGIGKLPDEVAEDKLRCQKRDPGFGHGFGHLLVNGGAVSGNVLRHPPGVPQNGNRRHNCDYKDRDRE